MPHYKSGVAAVVGDLVRGTGYNVKHEIVGVVASITPGASSCNITVLHAVPSGMPAQVARLDCEYGQADAFEKIERA